MRDRVKELLETMLDVLSENDRGKRREALAEHEKGETYT